MSIIFTENLQKKVGTIYEIAISVPLESVKLECAYIIILGLSNVDYTELEWAKLELQHIRM